MAAEDEAATATRDAATHKREVERLTSEVRRRGASETELRRTLELTEARERDAVERADAASALSVSLRDNAKGLADEVGALTAAANEARYVQSRIALVRVDLGWSRLGRTDENEFLAKGTCDGGPL